MSNKKVSVKIGKTIYESCVEAAKALKVPTWKITNALATKKSEVNGKKVKRVTINPKAIKKADKRPCPVYCETTGKTYKSITHAARIAKVRPWTMGYKMEGAGKFICKKGHVYTRLRPMNTKNDYSNTSPELEREFTKKKTKRVKQVVKFIEENSANIKKDLAASAKALIDKGEFEAAAYVCAARAKI